MKYEQRLLAVIDYIGKHLDEPITLDQLSSVACFSKYHFHRIFSAQTGMSVQQYIRWLRLKRAAYQLIVDKEMPIITIAIDAGFESHEAFTRAFKQACGFNPKEFRANANWENWVTPPYRLPKLESETMNVEIKNMTGRRLAVLEHRGDPNLIGESVNQLVSWAKSQPENLKPEPGAALGFAYDDPATTPPEEYRYDLALTIPESVNVSGDIIERRLPAGRYAVAVHKGSRANISDTVYGLYRDWLPNSGEELADLPCIFAYYNFDFEVADTELVTECWLLLK